MRGDDAGFNVNTRTNPFDLSDLPREERAASADLRARALDVIERHVPGEVTDSAREGATRTAQRSSSKHYDAELVNRHIIESSHPDYVEDFRRHVATAGQFNSERLSRAAMSLTAANGGVLVPQFLDSTIVLTNDGTENEIRQISGQVSITTDQWDGVTSAGVTAGYAAEATEASDNSPTFVAPTIRPERAQAYIIGSFEMIADTGFDEVGMLFMDAFDRADETAMAVSAPVPTAPKVKGVSKRKVWKFEVTDVSELPPEYLIANEKAIGGVVRALKDKTNIPGVRVYFEETLAAGS